MSVKITLPAPPSEDDIFPWLYTATVGNIALQTTPRTGTYIRVGVGSTIKIGDPVTNYDNRRLTRDEIAQLGLTALIPPAKKVPQDEFRKGCAPFNGTYNYWVNEQGTPFVITSQYQAVALAGGQCDGSIVGSVSTGGFVQSSEIPLKNLPAGTVIEITVE